MATQIRALDGDTIDSICWRLYGSHSDDVLAQVFALNHGIAATETLTAGQIVTVPETVEDAADDEGVSLWD